MLFDILLWWLPFQDLLGSCATYCVCCKVYMCVCILQPLQRELLRGGGVGGVSGGDVRACVKIIIYIIILLLLLLLLLLMRFVDDRLIE